MATCYRHPSRETGVSCSNCGRPICPDCMTPTPVGMRCPECASQRTKVVTMRSMSQGTIPVTIALIAINVIAFLASGQFGATRTATRLYTDGALIGSDPFGRSIGVAYQEYWRLVTSAFLHAGFIHILFNMYILYVLGQMLEPAIGSARFLGVYVVSMFGGAMGALLTTPHGYTVGASGAIFGLMGATAVEAHRRGFDLRNNPVTALIVLNLVLSFALPGISYGGHIGGLVAGGLAGAVMLYAERVRQPLLVWLGFLLLAGGFAAGAVATAKNTEPTGPSQQLIQQQQQPSQ